MPLLIGRATTIGLLSLVFAFGFCLADESGQQSFNALLGKGYKVVATSYIQAEAQTDKKPVILVTLLLDKNVAVCTMPVGAWETIASSKFAEDNTRCDIRVGQ